MGRFAGLAVDGFGGFGGVAMTLFTNPVYSFSYVFLDPDKLLFLAQLLLPLLGIPLLAGAGPWIVALPGFATLLLDRYKSGGQGKLVTVDGSGEAIGSLDVSDEVLHLSAAGNYVAVLYADRLIIYDKEMNQCAVLSDISSAKYALVRSDGSALLTGSSMASLYLP